MSGLLRRPGALASVASRSWSSTARSSLRPSRILRAVPAASPSSAQTIRRFATKKDKKPENPKKPEKDEEKNKPPTSEPEVKSTESPDPDKKRPVLVEGWEHITNDEFRVMIDLAKPPAFIQKFIGADDEKIAKRLGFAFTTGVPSEMKQLLKKQAEGHDLNIADQAKLLKNMNELMSRARDFLESRGGEPDSNAASNAYRASSDPKNNPTDFTQNSEKKASESGSPQPPKPGPGKGTEWTTTIISGIVAWWIWQSLFGEEAGKDISWQEVRKNFLDKGLIERMVVMGPRVRVELNREATQAVYPETVATKPGFNYYFTIGSVESFEKNLNEAQEDLGIPASERIPVSYSSGSSAMDLFLAFGPTALLVGLLIYVQRRGPGGGGSGIFGVGKSTAKRFNHESAIKIKFADVAGMDEAKQEILEFVSFLKQPERFQRLGAKIPRGAILAGPPGTGKTMLAKATAGESGVPFYSVSGSEFVEMFVGVGASRVRDLFATARKNAPCIIFIDEIDAIGKSRSEGKSVGGGHDEREATLNQILTEMDGFNTSEQVVVLAGTNRVDILDRALMRPGRFDRHVNIDKPTMAGRQDIFKVYLKKIVTNEEFEYLSGRLAALTPGFAGADISNCVNEAALIAARNEAHHVTMQHFEQAIERVIGGLERKSLVLNPKEKRTVAYHEAGHAICGWFFEFADPLLKVSIIPRGMGLGYAQYLPGDAYLMNYQQLMDRMAMTLGGRISEEMHFPTVTTGAADDFKKVTQMATAMVTQYGMSEKVGPVHFPNDGNSFQKPFAEATGQTIDQEIKHIIEQAYKQCRDLLESKRKEIELIAEELLTKEVLVRDDMVRLLGKRPFEDRDEFNKYFNNEKPAPKADEDSSAPPSGDAPKAPDASTPSDSPPQ